MLTGLAYLGVLTPNLKQWPEFGSEVLGCAVDEADDSVRLRVDDAPWRVEVLQSDEERVNYIGWTVASDASFEAITARLALHGIGVEEGTEELLSERDAARIVSFTDPFGFRHELVSGRASYPKTFLPGRAMTGFVTGEQGLGHVVLAVPSLVEAETFFTEVLGFKLSDRVVIDGRAAHFFHASGRHHSLALAQNENFTGLHHLMLEVGEINDVGNAFDICRDRGLPVLKSIGRHANDQMVSFYVTTPSKFHIEYGTGGIQVEEGWEPRTYRQNSIWGHRAHPNATPGPGLTR